MITDEKDAANAKAKAPPGTAGSQVDSDLNFILAKNLKWKKREMMRSQEIEIKNDNEKMAVEESKAKLDKKESIEVKKSSMGKKTTNQSLKYHQRLGTFGESATETIGNGTYTFGSDKEFGFHDRKIKQSSKLTQLPRVKISVPELPLTERVKAQQ